MSTQKEKILEELEPLFKEAEEKGLWFWVNYQDLWFSPSELRRNHEMDRYVWGKINWVLRNPHEKILILENTIQQIQQEIRSVRQRIQNQQSK